MNKKVINLILLTISLLFVSCESFFNSKDFTPGRYKYNDNMDIVKAGNENGYYENTQLELVKNNYSYTNSTVNKYLTYIDDTSNLPKALQPYEVKEGWYKYDDTYTVFYIKYDANEKVLSAGNETGVYTDAQIKIIKDTYKYSDYNVRKYLRYVDEDYLPIILKPKMKINYFISGKGYANVELEGAEYVYGDEECCTYKMTIGDKIIINEYVYDKDGNKKKINIRIKDIFLDGLSLNHYTIGDFSDDDVVKLIYSYPIPNDKYFIEEVSVEYSKYNVDTKNDKMRIKIINK